MFFIMKFIAQGMYQRNQRDHANIKHRVKDWLYGVTSQQPKLGENGRVEIETETESLRSMFHLVTWNKKLGGAGVFPQHGKWDNVKAVFPLHNRAITKAMLIKWSHRLILRQDDLDQIRGLFGEKVCYPHIVLIVLIVLSDTNVC